MPRERLQSQVVDWRVLGRHLRTELWEGKEKEGMG